MATIKFEGECCTDCAMWIANGETPVEMSESETEAWVDEIVRRTEGAYLALGDDEDEFSWSQCDACGTRLGGARHAFVALAPSTYTGKSADLLRSVTQARDAHVVWSPEKGWHA